MQTSTKFGGLYSDAYISTAAAYIEEMQNKISDVLAQCIPDGPYAHIDFPAIRNVGDSAIWLGEAAFLRKMQNRRPDYTAAIGSFRDKDLRKFSPAGSIILRGGGNFGDIWVGHQDFRERVLLHFPDRPVIQMPQSIHFSSTSRLDQARRIISTHKNFTLLVRDERSLDIAKRYFDCHSMLCPDMAFAIGVTKPFAEPEFPVLAMLRDDKEKIEGNGSIGNGIPVEDWIIEDAKSVQQAARRAAFVPMLTLNRSKVREARYQAMATHRFNRGVCQISRASAIITDRLHVHIVSILLGKPHAVLDNNYGKISGFRSAFPEPDGLTFVANSCVEAEEWARDAFYDHAAIAAE